MSGDATSMRLKVLKPSRVVVEKEIAKILVRTGDGIYCLLPRHVDFITVLVPGPLVFEDTAGQPGTIRIEDGMLVKCGNEVLVSASDAVMLAGEDADAGVGEDAGKAGTVATQPAVADAAAGDRERQAREIVAGLEARFSREWLQTGKED